MVVSGAKVAYGGVVALGDQAVVTFGIDLQHWRFLAVETGVSARQGGQESHCQGAQCMVMHSGRNQSVYY